MQPKLPPSVGQTLYSLNIGNAARNCEQKLTPVVVTRVGRKFFTCEKTGETAYPQTTDYRLADWRQHTEFEPSSQLYSDPQQWEEEREIATISQELGKAFEYGHNRKELSLEKLRRLKTILNET